MICLYFNIYLIHFLQQNGNDAPLPDFEAEEPPPEPFVPPKGVYLHGPVGCGKTLLLDLFFDGCRTDRKLRVHFHAFVLQVNRWRVCSRRPFLSITQYTIG